MLFDSIHNKKNPYSGLSAIFRSENFIKAFNEFRKHMG